MGSRCHARSLQPLREQRAARLSRAGILPLPFASQSHHPAAGYDPHYEPRRRFRFRVKAKFFARTIFSECKIFLHAGGTCERGSRRGTGGPIRLILTMAVAAAPARARYALHAAMQHRGLRSTRKSKRHGCEPCLRRTDLANRLCGMPHLSAKPCPPCQAGVALRRRGSRLALPGLLGAGHWDISPLGAGRLGAPGARNRSLDPSE